MRILKQLAEAIGPSGAETEVRQIVIKLVEKYVDELITDTMGNVFAIKYGTAPQADRLRVMVDAHMDEVGLMVNGYGSDGTLKVAPIGGLDDRILLGKRVLVGEKKLPGIIGGVPVHLAPGSSVVKLKDMRVDIGASKKESAESKAPLGTRIAFDSEFMDLGKTVRCKAFDDRVGCAVLVHLLQDEARYPFDLIGAFTVQEEVGLRGAKVAAQRFEPHLAFALEGTICDDLPKEDDTSPTTVLGGGPALSGLDRMAIYDRRLNDLLINTAEDLGIPWQMKQPGLGATDAGSINTAGAGVPVAAVSVPCRYIHSPNAILSKQDYKNVISLMKETLARLDESVLAW